MANNSKSIDLSEQTVKIAAFVLDSIIDYPTEPSKANQLDSRGSTLGASLFQCLELILNLNVSTFVFLDTFSPGNVISSEDGSVVVAKQPTASELFERGEIDVLFGFTFFLKHRVKVANALLPISNEKFYVYFLQPKVTQPDYPFIRQFSSKLVLVYIAVMFLSAVLLAILLSILMNKLSLLEWHYELLLWAVGAWCQQGSALLDTIKKWQPRVVMCTLGVFSFLLYSMYCALIIATLTKRVVPIREMEHLLQYQYTFYAFGDAKHSLLSGKEHFWNVPPPLSKMENTPRAVYEKTMSIRRFKSYRHAHVDTGDNFYPNLEVLTGSESEKHEICERLSVFPLKATGLQAGFYAKKEFKFRNEFNYGISHVRESGVLARLLKRYETSRFQESSGCQNTIVRATYQDNLGMIYLGSIFTTLAISLITAILLCLLEFAHHHSSSLYQV